MAKGLGKWLSRRFVFLSEVAGYSISAAVAAFVLYAAFTETEVTTSLEGTLRPAMAPVAPNTYSLFLDRLADNGSVVAAGAPVCSVLIESRIVRMEKVRRLLHETSELLLQENDEQTRAWRAKVDAVLDDIPPAANPEILRTETPGVLRHSPDAVSGSTIEPGKPVATVYAPQTLLFEATITSATALTQGQVARIVYKDSPNTMLGEVQALGDSKQPRITIVINDVPDTLRDEYRAVLAKGVPDTWPTARAQIITGHQSLFKQLFGKR